MFLYPLKTIELLFDHALEIGGISWQRFFFFACAELVFETSSNSCNLSMSFDIVGHLL